MAENAAAEHHSFTGASCLLVFLGCLGFTLCADIDSLRCNLIVKSAIKPGQPWYEGPCSMNGKTLFQVTSLGKLTKEENGTQACLILPQSLKNILELMRDHLLNMESEQIKTMGNNTFQVTMQSQYNKGQLIDAFCNLTVDGLATDGQSSFHYNPTKDNWRGSGQWERNRELKKGLQMMLMGDFGHCYEELLTLSGETPRSTVKTQAIVQRTPATQIPLNSAQSTFMIQSQNIFLYVGLVFIALIT
ncbi:retinoic acid early-inducible protein 1-beta-like isoform X2 [Rattus norvegicus]|uniref:retinoic acid early-inducible protein 1-beta-like isoform X2 n=1 Tax=Rattus norvegicus TaxID=10116 RepID=UPI0003D09EC0|nr:retinoic acid early-inducible protein 1-beta-like isoform X2 [Rattus norvegicus]|eukprot:XP_008756857.1 PREDICTED: retinoic acid early-inducible protein 1-beta-like [Rattus norvegicus]